MLLPHGTYASLVLQMHRKLKNFQAEQPFSHAWYHMTVLIVDHCWRKEDLMAALEGMYVSLTCITNALLGSPADNRQLQISVLIV